MQDYRVTEWWVDRRSKKVLKNSQEDWLALGLDSLSLLYKER